MPSPHQSVDGQRSKEAPCTVELSPSPDPPRLVSTAGPNRLTTALPHTRSITNPDGHAACEGDVYVVNAMNGERFHLTVTLQGPFHPLTTVTHASLQRTVRNILLSPSSAEPPPTLLLEGIPLDESTTETLPNNAVIVVHRGVSVEGSQPFQPHRHLRSCAPSQPAPADGGITVVEMLSDSLPHSTTAPSEREMSLPSLRRPSGHASAVRVERPTILASHTRARSLTEARQAKVQAEKTPTTSEPSRRLPPRRAPRSAGGTTTGSATPPSEGKATVSATVTAVAAAATAPPSSFTRTNAAGGHPPISTAPAGGPSVTFSRSAGEGGAASIPQPFRGEMKSFLSSPSDEDAYVVRVPMVAAPAKPLGVLQDTGISAATVSAPSSIDAVPSLKSMNDTHMAADGDYAVRPAPPTAMTSPSPSSPPVSHKPTPAVTTTSAASSPCSKTSNSSSAVGEWDRSKLPPVTVLLPTSPPPGSSLSRPSTAFTSPAFSQKSPPSVVLHFSPTEQQQQQQELHPTYMLDATKDDGQPAATAAVALPEALSTPARCAASSPVTKFTTVITNSALFSTPDQAQTRSPDTSRQAATMRDTTADLTGPRGAAPQPFSTWMNATATTAAFTASTSTATTSVFPPPLPPHDDTSNSSLAASRQQLLRERVDARQVAYDAQRDAIINAAAAEQQRLLKRLQHHCRKLEDEKKALLSTRLAELRAQESAARLRVLRAAQEDAAAKEIDAVRARLGQCHNELLDHWLRVVHTHSNQHYTMPHDLLRELEAEGEQLSLNCLSSLASYHTQKARLQALQQERMLKEAAVARLKWESHVQRCTAEERRGCLRVVARVRPPLQRPWLPDWLLSSPEAARFDRGYAVHVPHADHTVHHRNGNAGAAAAAPSSCVEVVGPSRDVRRRYKFSAAYDDAADRTSGGAANPRQQRLFKEQLQPLLEHMCHTGQRVAVLAFGAVGSGKTYTLIGPPAEPPLPPPKPKQRKAGAGVNAAEGKGSSSPRASSSSQYSYSSDDDSVAYAVDEGGVEGSGGGPSSFQRYTAPQLQGISDVGAPPPRRGITRCLDPAEEETKRRVLQSMAAAEEEERQQRSSERHAHEERRWRAQAGIDVEDGLLPRAVAWLTAHLRSNNATHTRKGATNTGEPVVESVVFSMYEVYNDHIYDLLPAPPSTAASPPNASSGAEGEKEEGRRRVRSDPSTWPRWNAGWLPAPHIKNSNPEQLTELQMELVPPARRDSKEMAATLSQLQQPKPQPQWRVRASEMEVRSATDVLQAIELGRLRRRSAVTLRNVQSSRSHLFLRFRIEVQRPAMPEKPSAAAAKASSPPPALLSALEAAQGVRPGGGAGQDASKPKGYGFLCASLLLPSPSSSFADASCSGGAGGATATAASPPPTCVTELLFADFAGSERVELSGAAGDALKETQYINASLSAVAEVLTALARANPCDAAEGNDKSQQPNAAGKADTVLSASAASLVERWGAVVSRPGVSLSRGTPVFLQPRFTRLAASGGGRYRGPLSTPNAERGLPLRRRVLALMDTYAAGQSAAQWWRSWRASSTYIPFRTCKTTQLLQSTMGVPCKTLVLACVRPCSVAEVVLPASMQDRKGKRAREMALALLDHQAPLMLAEVHSTLTFADRVNTAAHDSSGGDTVRA
jgi:hypothetical protein